jgi:hypothetical protein
MSAAVGLGRALWVRHRWLFGTVGLSLLVLAVGVPALARGGVASESLLRLLAVAAVPLGCAVPLVLAAFAYGADARLEEPGPGFPPRLFTLPVPTAALVGWPMLFGALAVGLGWLVFAVTLRAGGADEVPLLWPALALAALLAWMQALTWAPFALPWLRLPVLAAVLVGLLVAGMVGYAERLPGPALAAGFGALLPAAYVVALVGVGQGRSGATGWSWPAWLWEWALPRQSDRPFASAAGAQLWLEWRQHGRGLVACAGLAAVLAVPALALFGRALDELVATGAGAFPPFTTVVEAAGSSWPAVGYLAVVPFLMALALGPELGRLRTPRQGPDPSAFLATRPLTTAALVGAKFRHLGLVLLAVWALFLLAVLLWALPAGRIPEMAERLRALAGGGPRAALALALGLATLLVLNWAHAAAGLWVGLSGRLVLVYAAVVLGLVGLVGAVLLGQWVGRHPEYHDALRAALPWLLGAALALKGLATAWVARGLLRRGLLSPADVARAVGAWSAAAAGGFATLCWLLPAGRPGAGVLAAVVVLALPLARCLLAPLALAWNRHR